jgi:YcxB-like protein
MTPIKYALLPADVLAAARLGFIRIYRKNLFRNAAIVIAIAAVISGAGEYLDGFVLASFLEGFGILTAIYAGLFVILVPITWYILLPRRTKKTFRQMPAISLEQTLSWDDEAIMISSSHGQMRVPCKEFHRWAANDKQIIIYPADHVFYVLPRRIFASEQDFAALAELLHRSGVTKI